MTTYEFLSDEWMDAVEALRDEMPAGPDGADELTVNMHVVDGPFGTREAHLTGGQLYRGLIDGAPTTITVPHDVARSLLVDGDPAAAMQAFMAGKIKVEGDMTKLLATMQQASTEEPTAEQLAFAQKLRELTA